MLNDWLAALIKRPKEYCVVWGSHPESLQREVEEKLSLGWRLQGGVSLNEFMLTSTGSPEARTNFCQALCR